MNDDENRQFYPEYSDENIEYSEEYMQYSDEYVEETIPNARWVSDDPEGMWISGDPDPESYDDDMSEPDLEDDGPFDSIDSGDDADTEGRK